MLCTHPINDSHGRKLPCGRCISCRVNRTQEWGIRLRHELGYYPGSLFLTLTYNQDNLPDSLVPKDLQLWLKRFRKELDGRKIKYYAVGEYGERYNRPHYHAIVFNCDKGDAEIIRDTWRQGFVHIGTVTDDSINYVCGYIQKNCMALWERRFTGKDSAVCQDV